MVHTTIARPSWRMRRTRPVYSQQVNKICHVGTKGKLEKLTVDVALQA